MSPYSSNLSSTMMLNTPVVHEADESHGSGKPVTLTVAVMLELIGRPVVSTTMELVSCPLSIVPSETVHFQVGLDSGSAPAIMAVKIASSPFRITSLQETLTVGHSCVRRGAASSAGNVAS